MCTQNFTNFLKERNYTPFQLHSLEWSKCKTRFLYLNILLEILQGEALKLVKEVNTCSSVTYQETKEHSIKALIEKTKSNVFNSFLRSCL